MSAGDRCGAGRARTARPRRWPSTRTSATRTAGPWRSPRATSCASMRRRDGCRWSTARSPPVTTSTQGRLRCLGGGPRFRYAEAGARLPRPRLRPPARPGFAGEARLRLLGSGQGHRGQVRARRHGKSRREVGGSRHPGRGTRRGAPARRSCSSTASPSPRPRLSRWPTSCRGCCSTNSPDMLTRMPSDLSGFIARLPKAELHVHHVGSASPRIVSELAARHPGTVPSDPDEPWRRSSPSATSPTSSRSTSPSST